MSRRDSNQTEPPLPPLPLRHKFTRSVPFFCLSAWVLLGAIPLGGGCTWAPRVRDQLRVELARPDFFAEPTNRPAGPLSFAEASRRWVAHDPDTMQQITKALADGLDVSEANSWTWPRADVEFEEVFANEQNGSLGTQPSGGLVLRYDFKKALFHADAAAVSAAGHDLCLQNARIKIDCAIGRFEDLVLEWRQLRDALSLQEQRVVEFHRLMEAVHTLDQLGALPAGSFADWKNREQGAQRERSEVVRRLEGDRQALQTGLGLNDQAEPDLEKIDFLLEVPALPEGSPGEIAIQRWLPALWHTHPACRVAELELFQAAMKVIDAKRERLPRLTGSIGLGDMETWIGANQVRANATAEIGVSMPLFDAGTIGRGIEKAALQEELARRNVRNVTWGLVRDAQNAITTLRTAQLAEDHRRTECEDVRRLAEVAKRAAVLGQGDPLSPYTLRIYEVEAKLGELEAKVELAKAWRAYRTALGQETVPGLSSGILAGLVHELATR